MAEDPTVALSTDTYATLLRRVDDSDFDSADEYVEFVLTELFAQLEGPRASTENDEEVRDRLRELGYLE